MVHSRHRLCLPTESLLADWSPLAEDGAAAAPAQQGRVSSRNTARGGLIVEVTRCGEGRKGREQGRPRSTPGLMAGFRAADCCAYAPLLRCAMPKGEERRQEHSSDGEREIALAAASTLRAAQLGLARNRKDVELLVLL